MARLCVLCYSKTNKNLPFCSSCYRKYKFYIDNAIQKREKWLRELEILTQREYRYRQRERNFLPLYMIGEDIYGV